MWRDVKRVVVLGLNYGPDEDPLVALAHKTKGVVSVYARGGDYHDLIKEKLKRIAQWLVAESASELKVFVDTAPVMEKPLAEAAGLGWQGKHTNVVSRTHGSWLFLGVLFTNLELPEDAPEPDHCGSCRACLDVCPTKAFPAPYKLDARRCISYLTIEHKGPGEPCANAAGARRDGRRGIPRAFCEESDQTNWTRSLSAQRSDRDRQQRRQVARTRLSCAARGPRAARAWRSGLGAIAALVW
jgi:epoxyqueuosine reductase QueG